MYVEATPSKKSQEYNFLKLWVHNELTKVRHHYNAGWALIKHGAQNSSEAGFKCARPENGQVYFLFPPSVPLEDGDLIAWGAGSGVKDEWVVTSTNLLRECLRCEVRRPTKTDQPIDDLLRSASLTEAAQYLANARERLNDSAPAAWSDCVSNCRNALQATLRQLTGEGQLSMGIRKLKEVCQFGEREVEYTQALEKLFITSRDLLSKTGAHPPMPSRADAAFVFDVTTATLRYIVTTRKV